MVLNVWRAGNRPLQQEPDRRRAQITTRSPKNRYMWPEPFRRPHLRDVLIMLALFATLRDPKVTQIGRLLGESFVSVGVTMGHRPPRPCRVRHSTRVP